MDEGAFASLYLSTHADLRRFVARRLASRADVDDVVADCYLVAWRRSGDVPPEPEAARRWLFAVAANGVRNQRRGELRRAQLGERVLATSAGALVAEIDDDARTLVIAFAMLSADDQEVLALAAAGHLGPALATALGCSVSAATSRLARARRRLSEATDQ